MIKSLSIQNYALIQSLELTPAKGLSIITGETGAGKSIMLGALGLLMGNRADTKSLWDETSKCTIEAVFDISQYQLEDFFRLNDLDFEFECILRREILPSGKSRAFINDTPVNLSILKDLSPFLMDIHSQHDGLLLGAESYQTNLLDTFAAHQSLLADYRQAYQVFKEKKNLLDELMTAAHLSTQEEDYKRFILRELEEIQLETIDIDVLEEELSELENAEEILSRLSESDHLLDQSETSIISQLKEAHNLIQKLSQLSHSFQSYYDRIESTLIELKDVHADLKDRSDQIIIDPERMQQVKQQVDAYHRLLLKHRSNGLDELINLRDQLSLELNLIDNREGEIEKAKTALQSAKSNLLAIGKELSKSRSASAKIFAQEIEKIIHQLGIENGTIAITVSPDEPETYGMDQIEFMFSANKGISPKPIREVASGGEFSRLIFAIKYLIAQKTAMPTVIFDEIDTGVSGEVAKKMIGFMKQMSTQHQIISISHLPQFAAGGELHFYVYKDHSSAKTETKIKLLNENERIEQIARMIAGDQITPIALDNARELLKI